MRINELKSKIKKKCPYIKYFFKVRNSFYSAPYYFMRFFSIKNNKIVLTSFHGKYGGDPKYISEELLRRNLNLDIVWLLDEPDKIEIPNVRKVKYGSYREIYELATAKVWIDDCRKNGNVRKRKSQFYVGTGHGGIPMKKIEKDAVDKLPLAYLMMAENDSNMTDLKPSNSQWRNDMLRRAFWYSGEIYNCGLPRVERLIKEKESIREVVRNYYGVDADVKFFMYAPTFREVGDMAVYNLDFKLIKYALEQRFGGRWIGLRRLHPNIRQYNKVEIEDVVIDATNYSDMEDLMLASDVLITDYSSCLFETFFVDIPAFIYAIDIEDYLEKERGLYWDIYKLPFSISRSNAELVDHILSYDENKFVDEKRQLEEKIGFFEDQIHATSLLVDRIISEMGL